MSASFSGQRILVTGASKGIGRAIALHLASLGAEIVACGRDSHNLKSLEGEIGCRWITADLTLAEETARAGREAGPVEYLVNNAGISIPQPLLDTTVEAFDRTLAINVRAPLLLAQLCARDWITRGHRGAIVNVSSQASLAALRDHATYCASKAALDHLTRVMALELGPHGIRANAINPTVTLTDMGRMAWSDPAKSGPMLASIPLGRFAEPAEVAEGVAFLLGPGAAMITGTTLPVDGGFLA